jgi:hypothetical protein
MNIVIREFDLHLHNLRTRLPFKYGIATMTEMPYLFLRLRIDVNGRGVSGIAADCLPPKWFTKDPERPVTAEILEMLDVIEHAAQAAVGLKGDSAFALWEQLHVAQAAWGVDRMLAPLLTHFGTSLVERALIEAVCRHLGRPFAASLRDGAFGLRLGDIHPVLKQTSAADWLPSQPLARVTARHTVGLADPLTEDDISDRERLHDGLPQSLVSCIARYGLRHFKIKVSGKLAVDLERLHRIAAVVMAEEGPDFAFSLDGNEAFTSVAEFRAFWEALQRDARIHRFCKNLLFVEQPLHRAVALAPEVGPALAAWPERPPLVIDESEATLASLPTALELGYAGTSHKNCKGVFKGVANRCLLLHHRRAQPERAWLMSGEDLCNVGPVAVLQDLAVMAALGIHSVERNGHHYVAGLSGFPAPVQNQTLAAHGDLYQPSAAGWPTLRLDAGQIALSSVNAAPFGVGGVVDVSQFTPVAAWRRCLAG